MLKLPSLSAQVRIFAAEPGIHAQAGHALCAALTRLLLQFEREGRCTASGVTCEMSGRFIVLAWEGPALSGCSHDKIAQVVAHHQQLSAVEILSSPPIAISDPIMLIDRGGLRALLAQQTISSVTLVWPRWAQTLGEWQSGPRPLSASPFAQMIPLSVGQSEQSI